MDEPPRGAVAAARIGLDVEVRDVGPSGSMQEHEGKLGVAPGSLCKTLVVRRDEDDYVLVVVPGPGRMDWKKVRAALGVRRATMATREQALAATGYEPGTITPLGASRDWPVLFDRAVMAHEVLAIGSGRAGTSLVVDRDRLVEALDAVVADLIASD